jgi:uncharacterized protein
MENNLFRSIIDKNHEQIRKILSADPLLANEGVALNNDPNAKKGHPLHRLCDAVFAKKITDNEAIEIAKIFLEFGANINGYQALKDNNTPLIAAASLHAEKLGIFYIEQGAEIFYASPNDGATALHWAAFCGLDQLVQKLIGQGAKIDQRDDSFDGTPLDWAVHELRSGDGDNLFHQAACIKLLMEAGTALNSADAEYLRSIDLIA